MLDAVPLWLHLLAAATWVGSQVMMFVVVIPSLRLAAEGVRYQVLQKATTRFGYLGFGSLLLLVITGIDNMTRYSPDDMFDLRYGYILATKIALVVVVVLLTAYHAFVVGPRLLDLQQSGSAPEEVRGWRARSIAASSATLLFSLVILFCAALLRSRYAYG